MSFQLKRIKQKLSCPDRPCLCLQRLNGDCIFILIKMEMEQLQFHRIFFGLSSKFIYPPPFFLIILNFSVTEKLAGHSSLNQSSVEHWEQQNLFFKDLRFGTTCSWLKCHTLCVCKIFCWKYLYPCIYYKDDNTMTIIIHFQWCLKREKKMEFENLVFALFIIWHVSCLVYPVTILRYEINVR